MKINVLSYSLVYYEYEQMITTMMTIIQIQIPIQSPILVDVIFVLIPIDVERVVDDTN